MLETLPGFVEAYWMYLAGAAVLCALLCYFSEKMREYLKKAGIILAVVFALIAGYELITGDNILNLPGDVDRELSKSPVSQGKSHRYYKSYEERFGEPPPDDGEPPPDDK